MKLITVKIDSFNRLASCLHDRWTRSFFSLCEVSRWFLLVLPIGSNTLCYGSSNGGITIEKSDSKLNDMMKTAAHILNLKPHRCGVDPANTVEVYSAVDLEGHKNANNERYLLDFSRVSQTIGII